jgi:protein-S-isoprenylcysteine O-methyltransferase Ste14
MRSPAPLLLFLFMLASPLPVRAEDPADMLEEGIIKLAQSQMPRNVAGQSAAAKVRRPLIPPFGFLSLGLVSLLCCLGLVRAHRRSGAALPSPAITALARWTLALAIISLLYAIYYGAYHLPDWFFSNWTREDWDGSLAGHALWPMAYYLLRWLYFAGPDYAFFTSHLANAIFLYVLLAHPLVLRWVVRPDPASDKGWHLANRIYGLFGGSGGGSYPRARLAVLALAVKAFFAPFMCSWAINDIYRLAQGLQGLRWEFDVVQPFLFETIITVDVCIFAFAYLVELPQLDNEIKSVETTTGGWAVCLMCYPPFNHLVWAPARELLPVVRFSLSGWSRRVALVVQTGLWAFYTSASVALGPKGSNLTNRGVVDMGPYAYIRHPHYASKLVIWLLGSLALSQKSLPTVAILMVVYTLRAITEERHLKADPEYVDYCERVPFRYLPRVF